MLATTCDVQDFRAECALQGIPEKEALVLVPDENDAFSYRQLLLQLSEMQDQVDADEVLDLLSSQEKASPREAVTGWPPSDGEICAAQSGGTFATDKQVLPGLALLLLLSTSRFPLSASFTNSKNCDGPFAKI